MYFHLISYSKYIIYFYIIYRFHSFLKIIIQLQQYDFNFRLDRFPLIQLYLTPINCQQNIYNYMFLVSTLKLLSNFSFPDQISSSFALSIHPSCLIY
jgi:hypothetical protein